MDSCMRLGWENSSDQNPKTIQSLLESIFYWIVTENKQVKNILPHNVINLWGEIKQMKGSGANKQLTCFTNNKEAKED